MVNRKIRSIPPSMHPSELAAPIIRPAESPKHNTTKGFDGLLSGGAFAVLVLVCLTIGALALLA
ncbi:MAG: hypothetical protein DLM52_13025 [Chthoniobacterales bacterium]|nr:MAG: hypothetical protein DLM52_13025 [Chthoniobacterales bacterium]